MGLGDKENTIEWKTGEVKGPPKGSLFQRNKELFKYRILRWSSLITIFWTVLSYQAVGDFVNLLIACHLSWNSRLWCYSNSQCKSKKKPHKPSIRQFRTWNYIETAVELCFILDVIIYSQNIYSILVASLQKFSNGVIYVSMQTRVM